MQTIKRLWPYLKPYWKWAAIAPFLMTLEVLMDLQQPRLLGSIVDVGIANHDMAQVLTTGGLMVSFGLIGAFGGGSNGYFATKATMAFAADLRSALFRKVQSMEFGNLDEHDTGELVTRLTNDVTQIQNALIMILRMMVRAPLMLLGGVAMAITTSPRLALLILALAPIIMTGIVYAMRKAFPMFGRVQLLLDRVNTVMQESLAGARVVKAFVRDEYEIERFGGASSDLRNQLIDAIRVIALVMPLMMGTVNLGIALALWFGGKNVVIGTMQVGQVLAFVNYMQIALGSMMFVAMLLMNLSRASASAVRVVDILDTEPTIIESPDAAQEIESRGRVAFDHVTFGYDGDEADPALVDVSFEATPGETIAILGATGSGKSTLVNLIPRFYDVSQGAVCVDGVDVRDIGLTTLRRSIGVALQEAILFSGSLRDNIRYGRPEATDEEVVAAAKAAQAHEFITETPEGYDTLVGQRGVNLSGGQKQRVAIARALLTEPSILILDDSTSAVDVETEALIQDAMEDIMRGRTSFVIAQRISTVLEADRILVLDEGRIAAQGSHEELMATSPIYQEIYESQLGDGGNTNG